MTTQILIGAIGLCLGSFLNVCIYRIPRRESLWTRSRCPACGCVLGWRQLIPVVSYVRLRGTCRSCAATISPRYVVVETVACAASVLLFQASQTFTQYGVALVLFLYLLLISAIDMRTMRIPNVLILFGCLFWLMLIALKRLDPLQGLLGAFIGGGILLAIKTMADFIYARETMGLGDVKLAFVLGLLLGPANILPGLALAFLAGGVVGLVGILTGLLHRSSKLPFGAFLSGAAWLVVCYHESLIAFVSLPSLF